MIAEALGFKEEQRVRAHMVRLTYLDGKPLWINAFLVTGVDQAREPNVTSLVLAGDTYRYDVGEAVSTVIELLTQARLSVEQPGEMVANLLGVVGLGIAAIGARSSRPAKPAVSQKRPASKKRP